YHSNFSSLSFDCNEQDQHSFPTRRSSDLAVGGDAQQFQPLAVGERCRQGAQAVAGQHQFLQALAAADFVRQGFQLVVGENQPAQLRRQGGGRQAVDLVGLEAHHLQFGAIAEHGWDFAEAIVRAEQDTQPVQPRQIVRQAGKPVAGEVEHLQAVGQGEDLPRKLCQPLRKIEPGDTRQLAASETFQCVHVCPCGYRRCASYDLQQRGTLLQPTAIFLGALSTRSARARSCPQPPSISWPAELRTLVSTPFSCR